MTDYATLLGDIAVPRRVGTPNHEKCRAALRRELIARGFEVEERPFTGRPAVLLRARGPIHGVNLIARRPGVRPNVWLVAHYDSKGQPISMAARLAGVLALVLGAGAILVHWVPAALLLGLGVVTLALNRVTDESDGAVDNATGVLTVLAVADQVSGQVPVGVVFSDGEEYGLLGAADLARSAPELFRDAAVVNFDGIDDRGSAVAFVHRAGPLVRRVGKTVARASWRWLPVVVDGIALGRVARECVTIMKGNARTTRLVHTAADTAERLTLDGVRAVAEGVARALKAP